MTPDQAKQAEIDRQIAISREIMHRTTERILTSQRKRLQRLSERIKREALFRVRIESQQD